MNRRASLPGAAELFRATGPLSPDEEAVPAPATLSAVPAPDPLPPAPAAATEPPGPARGVRQTARRRTRDAQTRPSGRERHDEKITVYLSADELFGLEQARLQLRGEHGLAVDRGRIVREAIVLVVADLEARGESATLVRRLREG